MLTLPSRNRPNLDIAADLATALDPVALARRAGVQPDPWQRDLLRSTSDRILLNCSRQSGKSTTTAFIALHRALYAAGSLVLVLAPGQRQSMELFRKLRGAYGALGATVPADAESAMRLELANGSRIEALPGKEDRIRGFSGVDLLIVDEAARVPDALYVSVRPMLAVSGGRLIALSTPFGTRGWWFESWAHGGDDWQRLRVPATDCPRIPPAFLEEERRTIGEWWFRQEYGCEFLDAETSAFARADIDAAFATEVATWDL